MASVALAACRGILGIDDGTAVTDAGATAGDAAPDGGGAHADAGGGPATDGGVGPPDSGKDASDGSITKGVDDSGALDFAAWPVPAASPGAANYTVDAETATDKTTGLMWERGVSGKVVYANAPDHCVLLKAGGFTDWRLPTWIELFSIVDFGAKNPAIDATAFPGTPSEYFWSSTISARTKLPLAVFFFSGAMNSLPTGGQLGRVRCVRNP